MFQACIKAVFFVITVKLRPWLVGDENGYVNSKKIRIRIFSTLHRLSVADSDIFSRFCKFVNCIAYRSHLQKRPYLQSPIASKQQPQQQDTNNCCIEVILLQAKSNKYNVPLIY